MLPLEKLHTLRRTLHAHPEVSGEERATAARIASYFNDLKPDELLTGLGGHGLVATFDSGTTGPTLLFRCELDALPIQETNDFAHQSSITGVSHKCGHDGHMAIVCGLAELLADRRPQRGKVHLLFQPAEETGQGAEWVLRDPRFAEVKPDMAIALHNFPGYPHNAIVVKDGLFTAAVSSLIIRLQGRTSHASEPERGINPALAVAELLRASDALNLNDPESPDFSLVTPVHVRIGSPAYGVSAGDAEVHFTLRRWDTEGLAQLRSRVVALAEEISARHGLQFSMETLQHFHANVNDSATTDLVRQAAQAMRLTLIERTSPVKGGEDFGIFTSRFPCCMFGLGAGEDTPALHSPDYDFPDAIVESGVRVLEHVARRVVG